MRTVWECYKMLHKLGRGILFIILFVYVTVAT